ncbi:MAG TPA: hypothetical protein ENG55_00240, partial [Candidatus Omnitrophica bacterium]|nr:hypothetical protein [Candidatus Omnitrophota bacterium]
MEDIERAIRQMGLIENTVGGITKADIKKVTIHYLGSGIIKDTFRVIAETKAGNSIFTLQYTALCEEEMPLYNLQIQFMKDFHEKEPHIAPEVYCELPQFESAYLDKVCKIITRGFVPGKDSDIMQELYPHETDAIYRAEAESLMRMYKAFYDEDAEKGPSMLDAYKDDNFLDRRAGNRYLCELVDFDLVFDIDGTMNLMTRAEIIEFYTGFNHRFDTDEKIVSFFNGLLDAYGKEEGKAFLDIAKIEAEVRGLTDVVSRIDNYLTNHYPNYIAPFKHLAYLRDVDNIFYLSDIHGGYEQFVSNLINAGIIAKGEISGKPIFQIGNDIYSFLGTSDMHIVILGDIVNKGPKALETIQLIWNLEKLCHTTSVMGGMEAEVLQGDWRDINPKYFGVDADNLLKQIGFTDQQIPEAKKILNKWGELPHRATLNQILDWETWEGIKRLEAINIKAADYLRWLAHLPVMVFSEMSGSAERFLGLHAGITSQAWAKIKAADAMSILRNIDDNVGSDIDIFYSLVKAESDWIYQEDVLREIKDTLGIENIIVGHRPNLGRKQINEISSVGPMIYGNPFILCIDANMSPGDAYGPGSTVRGGILNIKSDGTQDISYGDEFNSPRIDNLYRLNFLGESKDEWIRYGQKYLIELLDKDNNPQLPSAIFPKVFNRWYSLNKLFIFSNGYLDLTKAGEGEVLHSIGGQEIPLKPPFTLFTDELGTFFPRIYYPNKVEFYYKSTKLGSTIFTLSTDKKELKIEGLQIDADKVANTALTVDEVARGLILGAYRLNQPTIEKIAYKTNLPTAV